MKTMNTTTWRDVPTRTIDVDGVPFAYRELGPSGGVPVVFLHHLMAVLKDARAFLFFPRDAEGKRAAKAYFARLKERTEGRDKKISLQARRAQVKAIRAAGAHEPDDLSVITQPVFIANGDHDVMVASSH